MGNDCVCEILLPTNAGGPIPSPWLFLEDGDKGEAKENCTLDSWSVPALGFSGSEALDILLMLPSRPGMGIVFGDSLRFFSEAAKLADELFSRRRFLPSIDKGSDGWVSAWRPIIEDDDRLEVLARAMCPCCRAVPSVSDLSPNQLTRAFVTALLDARVRRALKDRLLVLSRRGRGLLKVPPVEAWLASLGEENPKLWGDDDRWAPFALDLRAWTERTDGDASFRLCCRVEPPDGTEGADRSEWRVGYHLQALDDRSVLLDAADVWASGKRTLTFLKRKWENPQERLLAHLGNASRLSPAIEKSLSDPRPTGFSLSATDAYDFLRRTTLLLEQAGLGVLTPPWWSKPAARLGLKMKLSSKNADGVSSGLVGEEGIVDFSWTVALGDEEISFSEFQQLARLKQPLVQVRGQWVELRPEQIDAALAFFRKKRDRGEMALSEALRAGLFGEQEAGLPVLGMEAAGDIAPLFGGLVSGREISTAPVPESFRGKLRPYQERGLSWLAFLERFGLGACLADDMGLGKTIQLLALLLREREDASGNADIPPTLLLAPMSVLENWKLEARRFAPSLRVAIHHGPQRVSDNGEFVDQAKRHDLVLSTYALALRDQELFQTVSWRRVVLDEAQNIKNSQAKQTRAIRAIKASQKTALTGTPVENRLAELWSIMEFLNPGFLGGAEAFRRGFAVPIEKYRNAERAETLKRAISPFVLRRLKTDKDIIADLPEKIETKVFCPLTREQATLYQAVVNDMMEKIDSAEGIERKGLVLATLMKLKQVCNHPAQFLQERSVSERGLGGRSGKLARLLQMIEEILDVGDKALVFTQFAEMGKMLRAALQHATGQEALFLYGAVAKKKRDEMVARFQSPDGPPLFLLSVKAGGTGLNLTAASHVFHFDRWWNPAVENQATDRAFRIGQKKNVQVHKFVCQGTIEERIDRMIDEKKELADSVIGAGENMLTELSTDRLREMFALSRDAVMED